MSMRKRVSCLLLAGCLLASASVTAFAADSSQPSGEGRTLITETANKAAVSGKCGAKATWSFNSNTSTLTISGSGAMYDYELTNGDVTWIGPPWLNSSNLDYTQIKHVVIGNGITYIGQAAFRELNLDSITIPSSVTKIGYGAFMWSTLKCIQIPTSVTEIDGFAFYDCGSLKAVFYGGTKEQWNKITFGSSCWKSTPSSRKVYYSSVLPYEYAFADVISGSWYYDAVGYVYNNSLMMGDGNGTFRPTDNMSRAEMVQILYNREGQPSVSGSAKFNDVSSDAWYYEAIQWAAENEIVNGVGDGKFAPNEKVTREQLATILMRYVKAEEGSASLESFPDASDVSNYAVGAISWAVQNGVINGSKGSDGVNYLKPKSNATRAETAKMLSNYFSKQ